MYDQLYLREVSSDWKYGGADTAANIDYCGRGRKTFPVIRCINKTRYFTTPRVNKRMLTAQYSIDRLQCLNSLHASTKPMMSVALIRSLVKLPKCFFGVESPRKWRSARITRPPRRGIVQSLPSIRSRFKSFIQTRIMLQNQKPKMPRRIKLTDGTQKQLNPGYYRACARGWTRRVRIAF